MNYINQIKFHYLTPNKTVETLSVSDQEKESVFYVYNYKGVSFRVFTSKEELNRFWTGKSEEHRHFQTETELDSWLRSVEV